MRGRRRLDLPARVVDAAHRRAGLQVMLGSAPWGKGILMAEELTIRRTDRDTLPDDRPLPTTESIEYLQADRRRREHRGSFGYRLRPNGRTMFSPAPPTVLITRCDLKQTF